MNEFDLQKNSITKNELYADGIYHSQITNIEIIPTKKNKFGLTESENLVVTFSPIDGPCVSDLIDRLAIKNLNQESQRVGWLKLSIISQVCDVRLIHDPEEMKKLLLNKKLTVIIKNIIKNDKQKSFFYYEKYTENSK